MISVLCCGPCFDETAIAEDGSLYPFLDHLLEYKDAKVYQLAQETIVLLLEFNPDSSNILEWVVDRCFTGNNQVADGCFLALATIFTSRYFKRFSFLRLFDNKSMLGIFDFTKKNSCSISENIHVITTPQLLTSL